MESFQNYALPEALQKAISQMGFKNPTPIQEQVIPLILEGKDVLASSHTGSGKTGAFSIPLIAKILESEASTALVLTPTRELATQVVEAVKNLLKNQNALKVALLIGGDHMENQFKQLRAAPRIVIGTPGRVNDHLKRKTLRLNNCKFLVLDETDRMLDMGFGIQIDAILEYIPQARQTLLFSATLSKQIEKIASKYLSNPETIKIGTDRAVAPNLNQENINVTEHTKYNTLLTEINNREGSILIFVKTKRLADNIADRLSEDSHKALAIHGDLRQRQRDKVMKLFHSQKNRIMVATDIASRGLDIPHIKHVINYDPPQMAEDYIHRIGRTARAGESGSSLNLVSPKDSRKWQEINKMLKGGEPEVFVKKFSPKSDSFSRPRRRDEHSSFSSRPSFRNDRGSKFSRDDREFKPVRDDRSNDSREPRDFRRSERPKFEGHKKFFNREESSNSKFDPSESRPNSFSRKKSFGDRGSSRPSSRPTFARDNKPYPKNSKRDSDRTNSNDMKKDRRFAY